MDKILTAFCFTDIHNQQSMLDYWRTVKDKPADLSMDDYLNGKDDVHFIILY
jgi:hypothetical protein